MIIENKDWVWLQKEVTRISHALYKNNTLENVYVDDIVSEVMQYFVENPDKARKTIENRNKGNTSVFIFTVIKQTIYQIKWKQNYSHQYDYAFYLKIVNIAKEYDIELNIKNAYKLFLMYNALNTDKIKSIGCLQKMIEMDNCYKYGCENVKDLKTNLQNFEL